MRTTVMLLLGLATTACGKSAEDYAGSYNGDEAFKIVVASDTQESKETTTEKFTAVNSETLRMDSDECPVEFKMTDDASFAVVPRSCSVVESGTQFQLSIKTGVINFTGTTMALSFSGDVTANSVTGTFDMTFSGKRQ